MTEDCTRYSRTLESRRAFKTLLSLQRITFKRFPLEAAVFRQIHSQRVSKLKVKAAANNRKIKVIRIVSETLK